MYYKLLSFLAFLALAFAAPTPEPGAAIYAPGLAPVAYSQPLAYAALPAVPAASLAYPYSAPVAAYPAYPQYAYSKIY